MALADSLIAYWSLDEASGNAIDAHGSNDLAEASGSIGATTGKVSGARDFEKDDTEYFEIADNADLSTGNIDFTFGGWARFESAPASGDGRCLWSKGEGDIEYFVEWRNFSSENRFKFWVTPNGSSLNGVTANSLGAPSIDTWYFVVAWHDSAGDTINIQVNNGTVDSQAYDAGVVDGTSKFMLGSLLGSVFFHDGLLDELGFWKRVLTSDERTELYNGGDGRDYAYITGGPPAGVSIPIAMYHYMHHMRAAV